MYSCFAIVKQSYRIVCMYDNTTALIFWYDGKNNFTDGKRNEAKSKSTFEHCLKTDTECENDIMQTEIGQEVYVISHARTFS